MGGYSTLEDDILAKALSVRLPYNRHANSLFRFYETVAIAIIYMVALLCSSTRKLLYVMSELFLERCRFGIRCFRKKKKEFRVINFKVNSASKIHTKDTHTHKVIRNKHILW